MKFFLVYISVDWPEDTDLKIILAANCGLKLSNFDVVRNQLIIASLPYI